MEKIIGYICGDVTMLKHDMVLTARILKRMNKQHMLAAIGLGLCGCYIYYNEKDKKIETELQHKENQLVANALGDLRKEVEELKKSKGE